MIVKEIDSLSEKEPWLKEAKDYWEEQAVLSINGCIDPNLDRYLTDEHKLKIFSEVCQRIYVNILAHGDKISKDILNELCRYNPPNDIKEDNDTELYLVYGRALLDLLAGNQNEECKNA